MIDFKYKISSVQKELLFSELESFISSGVDFAYSFRLLISTETNAKFKGVLESLYRGVVNGQALWQVMKDSSIFSALDYGVIKIGEQTGRLSESLKFLTNYYSKLIEQRRMISSALRYPLIILGTAMVVVVFMLSVIVPMFEQVYLRLGGELPEMTLIIIKLSKVLPSFFLIFSIVVISIALYLYLNRLDIKVRRVCSAIIVKTPIIGSMICKIQQAHFCKLLYLLTSSGVPLLHSIELLEDIITFYPFQQSFISISKGLNSGKSLYDNMMLHEGLYSKKLMIMIRVGEETNRLPEMLRLQSEEITRSVEYSLQKIGAVLEPILVLFVGIIVAVILISMYLPMFSLGQVMG